MTGEFGPTRDEGELSDLTLDDFNRSLPSEESAIQIAESLTSQQIQNELAKITANIEMKEIELRRLQEKLEALRIARHTFNQAAQLAQDMNPGI